MADLSITGEVVVNSEKAEGAFDRVGNKAGQMATKVQAEATKAGTAVDGIGAGAERGAEKFTRAESRMREAIQRSTRELELLGKTASQKFEANLEFKGLDRAKFEPFLADLRKAEQATKQVESGLAGMGNAAALAGRAFAALGLGVSAGAFVKLADAATNVESRLRLVTSSAADLTSVQQKLFAVAQSSRVSFVDLAGTYAQVARSTKDLGVSQNALLGVIQTISQAVTISGGSAASAQAALTQLSQGFASGALRGEELNSILEQTPRLAQAIADGLGVSVGKLRELGQAGELTANKVLGALERSAASVASEFGRMTVTVEQASINAANSVLRLTGAFDRLLGVTSAVSKAITGISEGFDFLSRDIEKLGSQGPLRDAAREVINLDAAAQRLRNGMASGVLGPNAQVELDRINARLAEAKQRFRELDQQLSGTKDPRDQSGFTGRGASYANEAARQAKLRDDANTFKLNQAGVPASYLKEMAELIRLNQEGVLVGEDYTDALKKQQDELLKKTGVTKASNAAANQEQNTYETLIASIRAKIEADKLELAGGAALTESQKIRIKLDQDLAAGKIALGSAREKEIRLAIDELATAESALLAQQTIAKANLAAATSREKYVASLSTGLDKIRADIVAQEEATARMGLTKEAIAELDAAKLEMLATDLELQAIKAMDRNLDQQTYDALKLQAQAYRELAAAKRDGASKEMWIDSEKAAADAAKKASEDWKRTADDINRSLTDALLRGFESGKGFAKNLRDTVVNLFKTLVLRPIISAIVNPVAGAITGALGVSGAAQAATAAGGASNLIGGAGLLGRIGGGIGSFSSGLSAGFSGLLGEAGLMGSLNAGGIAIGAGNILGGLGTIVGALGPIAMGIGVLYSVIKKLDDSGTHHTGGAAQYSRDRGLMSGQSGAEYRIGFGRVEAGQQAIDAVGGIARGIGSALDAVAIAFGRKAGYEVATAFADDTSKDGAWGALRISQDGKDLLNWDENRMSKWAPKEFADGEEGYKQYLAAVAKDTRQILLDMDLPSWADTMLESLGDAPGMEALTSVIEQIGKVQTAFVSLGKIIEGFAGMTDEAFAAIVKASGGIEALSQNAATYYNNFYSNDERKAKAQAQLDSQFAELGIATPQSRDEFRRLVDQALADADVQAKNRTSLIGTAGKGLSGLISGGKPITIEDLGKVGLLDGIDPALIGNKPNADPKEQARLNAFLASVSAVAASDLKPGDMQASIEGIIEANAEVLGLGKDAGKTAAALLGLSGAFADLNESAEQAQERIRQEQQEARDKAFRGLERAIAKEKEALQVQMDTASEIANTMQSLFDLLHDSVRELYDEVEATRAQQATQGAEFIAQALQTALASGYLPDERQLAEAIASARGGLDSSNYSSQFELDRDRLILAGQLSQLEEVAGKQLTDAQKTLRELEAQSKQLDETLEYWREQIDIANGTFEATVSVEQAIRDLIALTFPETNLKAPDKVSGDAAGSSGASWGARGGAAPATVVSVSPTGLRTYSDGSTYQMTPGELDLYRRGITPGSPAPGSGGSSGAVWGSTGTTPAAPGKTTISDTGLRTYADGSTYQLTESEMDLYRRGLLGKVPAFAIGTNYVPRNMLAMIHEGEAVVPKAYNPAAGGVSGGRMEMLLEAMVEQNTRLEIRLAAIEGHTQDTSRATNGSPISPVPTALMENLTV